jgi:hypothetical protein
MRSIVKDHSSGCMLSLLLYAPHVRGLKYDQCYYRLCKSLVTANVTKRAQRLDVLKLFYQPTCSKGAVSFNISSTTVEPAYKDIPLPLFNQIS